jgi:hypothetical protein
MGWGSGAAGSDSRFIVPLIADSHGRYHAKKNAKSDTNHDPPASRSVYELFRKSPVVQFRSGGGTGLR